jgi:hypothetical protein
MLGRFVNYRQLLDQIDQLLDAITKEIMAFRAERARIIFVGLANISIGVRTQICFVLETFLDLIKL